MKLFGNDFRNLVACGRVARGGRQLHRRHVFDRVHQVGVGSDGCIQDSAAFAKVEVVPEASARRAQRVGVVGRGPVKHGLHRRAVQRAQFIRRAQFAEERKRGGY